MTFLIVPGFAKSGTTYIRQVLLKNARFHTTKQQEPRYFLRPDKIKPETPENYRNIFQRMPEARGDGKGEVVVETSPTYLSSGDEKTVDFALGRIKAVVPDARILVCLRHPARRAFSFYRHMIDNYAIFGASHRRQSDDPTRVFTAPYRGSFRDMIAEDPHLTIPLAARLEKVIDVFGADHVMLSFLETDGRDFAGFYPRLCDFLGIEDDGFGTAEPVEAAEQTEQKPNANAGFPTYYYGGEDGLYVVDDIALKPREFLIVSTRHEVLHQKITPQDAAAMMAARARWTRDLPAEEFAAIHDEFFRGEAEKLAEVIARHFPGLDNLPDYTADPGPGASRVLEDLLPTKAPSPPIMPGKPAAKKPAMAEAVTAAPGKDKRKPAAAKKAGKAKAG